jgi:PadR family transcriptional regulator, regulatory protein PadR
VAIKRCSPVQVATKCALGGGLAASTPNPRIARPGLPVGQVGNYIGYNLSMEPSQKLSHTAAMILQALHAGHIYGFGVMEATGLPSGTVYPALRRMERDEMIKSHWEKQSIADNEQRPPRKYYKLTSSGKATLETLQKRYPLLTRLLSPEEVGRA